MRRNPLGLVLVVLVTLLLAACADELSTRELDTNGFSLSSASNVSHYVVAFNGNKLPKDVERLMAQAGGSVVRTLPQVGLALVASADPGFLTRAGGVQRVQAVDGLSYHLLPGTETQAVPTTHADGPTAGDDLYGVYQWSIRRVNAPAAWDAGVTGSHDTVVAVIDTGIASNHPDLAPNLVYEACFAVDMACSNYPAFSYHGTHVAGTIAAAFGHGRAIGVGPDLALASYNVFEVVMTDEGPALGAYDFPIWEAIIDAADRGFEVVNMSLGGYDTRQENAQGWVAWNRVANYARQKGTVLVSSAGNEALDLNGPTYSIPNGLPGVISVAATDIWPAPVYPQEGATDVQASYSNSGASVDVAAPGGDCGPTGNCDIGFEHMILSTYVVADPFCAELEACPVGYAWAGGTSMAAPHVAAVAGLVMDENPGLNANQVSSIIRRTAEDIGSRQIFGHGMVDAYGATR